ncbi:RHS repeat domain-containing protein [Pseudomonas sp. GV085]|uniref:RHS repeat domain-containing protein n=1 Tax=Pseudomonas sp. GV085 TaxID=2135756 RepID=UPI002114210E|nr:RHS repeat-associated core domain-containing protein [Pseudomonas sp. GV085]
MPATLAIHRHTPSLTASDPRGLPVRAVGYWRDIDGVPPQARVNRTVHDGAGRAIAQWDPRLFLDASAPANLQTNYALSGAVLSTDSVDAGWHVVLLGEAQQPLHHWDGRGSQRWLQYDTQLRPESVFEQAMDGEALCAERLSYGVSGPTFAEHNQCGQLIRHDDPVGTQRFTEFGLHAAVLEQTRHFLQALSLPDWPELIADRELLLEPGEGALTHLHFNALGEVSRQTDAKDNRQFFSQTIGGQLLEVRLQLANDTTPKTLVSAIQYNAHGQIEKEVAGNGVVTALEYTAEDGHLKRLASRLGQRDSLQDLCYAYDPVGNVLSIEDAALPIRYFANRRIESINRYRYDSLYQLIEATGWEAGAVSQRPSSSTTDPAAVGTYRQTYRYDAGNNLLELTHIGPQNPGHRLVAAAHSNRYLPVRDGIEPDEEDFRSGFDANGNLLKLQAGQTLIWDVRNQLCEVRPVERDSGLDDCELYFYGADSMRVRKVRSLQTNAQTNVIETRYLPGLEIRTHSGTGEHLQVIVVPTGRGSVRVLHWETAPPTDITNNQQRYSLTDHLGSSMLELDQDANVITQERYYPFGGTAWSNGAAVQVSYKTARYSGKEQDATGLYYYGFRYYVPWLQRWCNSDPAGTVDGLNLFRMVENNPVTYDDVDGRMLRRQSGNDSADERPYLNNPLSLTTENTLPSTVEPLIAESLHSQVSVSELESAGALVKPLADAMGQLQLANGANSGSSISVLADIGGRDPIAGGGEGAIYESRDARYVYKKFYRFNNLTEVPGSVQYERDMFNAYYGAGSAKAVIEERQVYLRMIKLDGMPLDNIPKGSLPIKAENALLDAFKKMEKNDQYHQDPQDHNFLYSERDNKVYPVDMEAHPYEIAQYTINSYIRKKDETLKKFNLLIKR